MSSRASTPVKVVKNQQLNAAEEEVEEQDENLDILREHEMGYKQELYRGFSPFMSFAFCFTSVNVLTSMSISFTYALNTGGSAVAVWSWLIGSIFTNLVGLSLAEICSVYPTAGSVYYWAGQLVPIQYTPLASFICGWFNFVGNVAANAAFSSGFATIVNAALVLNGKDSLSQGAEVGISIGVTILWAIQNIFRIDQQGWLNNVAAVFQITSTIGIVILLFALAPERASAHDVFISTYNATGFSYSYMYCIGILTTLFSLAGYDAGAHLAEETRNASRSAPRGIMGTCLIGALVGAAYLLALLFAIPDIPSFVEKNSGENSTINFAVATYQLAVPHPGALALTILLILNIYFAGISGMTATSRIGFAMARDGVFPLSSYLRWIFPRTKTPLATIALVTTMDFLLLLLQLVSTTAFSAIISISTLGFQLSYVMPIFFRCTVARKTFPIGDFNLGRYSIPIAVLSVVWLIITSVFMFFPAKYPVASDNMNYAVAVIGGIALIAATYWIVSARHSFEGPKRYHHDPNLVQTLPLTKVHGKKIIFLHNHILS
ncbi:unnamed protein product [Rotaria sp. Silwood1]|nr:unnamed protein product [Rotaria sp. Silwood1]